MARISASVASLYAMAVVTWYLAMAATKVYIFQNTGSTICGIKSKSAINFATKIISYESYFHYLDEDVFEALLLVPSIAFLVYVVGFTAYQSKKEEWNSNRMVVDNDKVWLGSQTFETLPMC